MSLFSNFLSNAPLGEEKNTLPTNYDDDGDDSPTTKESSTSLGGHNVEKCEIMIEGMTCGSCVEVSIHYSLFLVFNSLIDCGLSQ